MRTAAGPAASSECCQRAAGATIFNLLEICGNPLNLRIISSSSLHCQDRSEDQKSADYTDFHRLRLRNLIGIIFPKILVAPPARRHLPNVASEPLALRSLASLSAPSSALP
jgi:hypothetical protein